MLSFKSTHVKLVLNMECVQDRPRYKQRSKHREPERENTVPEPERESGSARQGDTYTQGNTGEVENDTSESTWSKLNDLDILLTEQEEVFKTEQDSFETKKQADRERVTDLFERFRKLLAEKETELLHKIDSEYAVSGRFFEDFVRNIETDRYKVNDLLDSTLEVERENSIDEVREEIGKNMDIRDDVLKRFRVPNFLLNEESVNTVKNLSFGEFCENASEETRETESGSNNVENEYDNTRETDENTDEVFDGRVTNMNDNNENLIQENVNQNVLTEVPDENENSEDVRGAHGETRDNISHPTAPPVEDEEAPPPPYWQAVGLEQPRTDEQPQADIPGYYDIPHSPLNRLPDNKLQLWHSYPVRRQNDRRTPIAVGLTWNYGRICLADRANMKIKFFFPNGQLITEMLFGGTEIQGVAFLEECRGESRYIVSSPRSRSLMIISINAYNVPKMIRMLTFNQQYSCICRGPREQTLLGAEVATNHGKSVVNVFTFTGQILLSIGHTPTFNFLKYIKSVEVFGTNIIFLDWKLNTVAVIEDNGVAIGEYRGTANFPLVNPLDITVDNKGNIIILNGDFSNIHVIDQHCNVVEIIKIPRNVSLTSSSSKLVSFDTESQRLAVARGNGDIAVFTFEDGYDCLPQRNLPPNIGTLMPPNSGSSRPRAPEVLPLVEGMLPSTIEDIIMRQPPRNRSRQFHL